MSLIDTWHISNRINLFLLEGIPEEHLSDTLAGKGRSVGHQFAHLYNVRLMWIDSAAPETGKHLKKIEKEHSISKSLLSKAFLESAETMAAVIQIGIETGRVKGFKPNVEAFVGYLIAHEAHHRGQILLTLKSNGHLPDKKVLFGMWEWGVR